MFQKFIHRLLAHRHPWREISFSELSELYSSSMLRSFGMGVIGIFVPIYLYKLDFTITEICVYYVIFFGIRPLLVFAVGLLIARDGPKHMQWYSYVMQVIGLFMLLTLPSVAWPIALVSVVNSLAVMMYFIAFHVDFSKVKHTKHGGKELGYAATFDRLGRILGPLAGGLLASFVSPQAAIATAITITLFAAWPLFRTREPVKLHQKLDFNAFPLRETIGYAALYAGSAVDATGTAIIWPLFVAVFIATQNTYATVGWLTALGAAVSLFAARALGRLIDDKRVGLLFRYSVAGNAALYAARLVATSTGMVALINVVNEPLTLGYHMPELKAEYDKVDHLEGFRIISFCIFDAIANLLRMLIWVVMLIVSVQASDKIVLQLGLALAGVASLLMYCQNDRLLGGRGE